MFFVKNDASETEQVQEEHGAEQKAFFLAIAEPARWTFVL